MTDQQRIKELEEYISNISSTILELKISDAECQSSDPRNMVMFHILCFCKQALNLKIEID